MARMAPADRKESILESALNLAAKHGFAQLRMQAISDASECSNALVVHHFKTMTQLRRSVMRAAIVREILPIVAAGVAMGDPTAKKAPDDLKRKALASLTA